MWLAVLAGAVGCYAAKLLGLSLPQRVLDDARVQRVAALVPVTLLSALLAVQTLGSADRIVLDARVPALVVAATALLLRAPFLVVVGSAAVTAAALRALS